MKIKHTMLRTTENTDSSGETITHLLLSILLFFAIYGSLLLPDTTAAWAAMLPGCGMCILCSLWKKRNSLRLFTMGFLLLLCLIGSRPVLQGMSLWVNGWCTRMTASTAYLFKGMELSEGMNDQLCRFCFCLLPSLLLGILLPWLCRTHLRLAGLLCLIPALLHGFCAALSPLWMTALCVSACIAVTAQNGSGVHLRLLTGCGMTLLLLGVLCLFPQMRDGSVFTDAREDTVALLHTLRWESGSECLPEGNLQKPEVKTNGVLLRVSMAKPETLYLRGFTGDVFDGNTWKSISSAELGEAAGLIYDLHTRNIWSQTQAASLQRMLGAETEVNTVTVENLTSCSRFLYVPAGLTDTDRPAEELLCGSVLAEHGQRTYQYETLFHVKENMKAWLEDLNGDSSAALAARTGEAELQLLAKRWDTQLPADMEAWIPLLEEYRAVDGALTASEAIQSTCRLLDSQAAETIPLLGALDCREDAKTATMAVLALRYYGQCARYAEGYLTKESEFRRDGEWVKLTQKDSLIWPEIYQPGIGWVCLYEMPAWASAVGENTDSNSHDSGNMGESKQENSGEVSGSNPRNQPTEGKNAPESDGKAPVPPVENPPQLRFLLLLTAAIPVVLVISVLLRRKQILRRREKALKSAAVAEAVAWRYKNCTDMLKGLHISDRNGDLRQLERSAGECLGGDYAKRLSDMTELNYEALFSRHPISPEREQKLIRFQKETETLVRQRLTWKQRFRMKWRDCTI